eukprot:CAMPEP_0184235874 /NCGR_PEP_ID=MMETSP0976-20121227/25538_1 /TAXON_ID=483370 /ORGANISM="non described non described, Strain CCMP2097" /LENGTH=322 /DNA_ID=CAMNT_0026540959 /DNA_START=112 /DNA_END=1083 /DNA_ORIENTATION=+
MNVPSDPLQSVFEGPVSDGPESRGRPLLQSETAGGPSRVRRQRAVFEWILSTSLVAPSGGASQGRSFEKASRDKPVLLTARAFEGLATKNILEQLARLPDETRFFGVFAAGLENPAETEFRAPTPDGLDMENFAHPAGRDTPEAPCSGDVDPQGGLPKSPGRKSGGDPRFFVFGTVAQRFEPGLWPASFKGAFWRRFNVRFAKRAEAQFQRPVFRATSETAPRSRPLVAALPTAHRDGASTTAPFSTAFGPLLNQPQKRPDSRATRTRGPSRRRPSSNGRTRTGRPARKADAGRPRGQRPWETAFCAKAPSRQRFQAALNDV